jgi:hypothetical protein
MNKDTDWIDKHNVEIIWFYIGISLGTGIHHLGKGQWAWMLFNFTIMTLLIATCKKEK